MGCPEWQRKDYKKSGSSGPTTQNSIKSRELFHGAKLENRVMQYFADGSEGGVQVPGPDYQDTNAGMAEASPVSAPAKIEEKPLASQPQKFGDAFKAARASGAKEFEWQGKKYTTQLKEEVKPKQAKYDVGNEADKMFAKPETAKTFAEDVAERKAAMPKRPEPKAEEKPNPTRATGQRGRGYFGGKSEDGEQKKFSRFSAGGKYVPSQGVVVKKD